MSKPKPKSKIGNPIPFRAVLKEVPSGQIVTETGADGTYLRFECSCEDALPFCKSMCCSLAGISVTEEEAKTLEPLTISDHHLPIVVETSDGHEMRKGSDGWCCCIDRPSRACKIYEDRPTTCRDFHCTLNEGMRGFRLELNRLVEYSE